MRSRRHQLAGEGSKNFGRALRKDPTDAAKVLWNKLRGRQLENAKFRRDEPVGHYFADFYCVESRLVIEVDGGGHFMPDQQTRDVARDEFMKANAIEVVRFRNDEIFEHLEDVLEKIRSKLRPSP